MGDGGVVDDGEEFVAAGEHVMADADVGHLLFSWHP